MTIAGRHFVTGAQRLLWLAAALGASGVLLGAFGAHSLASLLPATDVGSDLESALNTWRTGVLYHLLHAVGVLSIALYALVLERTASGAGVPAQTLRAAVRIAWVWALGVVLFSGSLYAMVLGGPRWLGPVTPLGGLLMIVGWLLVALLARNTSDPLK